MPNVRGVAVLNAIRFVNETYGAARHDQIVAALPGPRRATFPSTIREASWEPRSFHDCGRMEVETLGPRAAVARVYDYPASRAMCQRSCGGWEALASTEGLVARVDETACVLDGHPCCATSVVWVEG